mmetsp:Transcript_32650/g.45529  ORF Transcript_32650/g.45529 Transcript_32650/m.45529 type:complete len:100 (-) Transcript_32650:936-1235(-)
MHTYTRYVQHPHDTFKISQQQLLTGCHNIFITVLTFICSVLHVIFLIIILIIVFKEPIPMDIRVNFKFMQKLFVIGHEENSLLRKLGSALVLILANTDF